MAWRWQRFEVDVAILIRLGCAAGCSTLLLLTAGCTAPPPPTPQAERVRDSDDSLVRLGEEALARGEIDAAAKRFERVLVYDPQSARARVGLGRVALHRADLPRAQAQFEAALAADTDAPSPYGVEARVGLADVAKGRGDPAAERIALEGAAERAPWNPQVHARLAEMTGPADRPHGVAGAAAVSLAEAHPYDPRALLAAGRALARSGADDAAAEVLERAVWLGDLDPPSATEAAALLVQRSDAWRGQLVVPVHLYGDATIRAEAGWEFRLRTLLLSVSNGLSPLFEVRFMPVSIGAFESGPAPDLDSIHQRFIRATASPPGPGILAAFTAREPPPHRMDSKQGIAEFFGRRLVVRLPPWTIKSRILAHEILHLYGAMHVADDIESLMNVHGRSLKLDSLSLRTVQSTRRRSFDGGGFERDVLPSVDLHEVIDAYTAALAANLTFREMGIAEVVKERELSRYAGRERSRQIERLDPHLADVARFLAVLMMSDERRYEALVLFEAATRLYGPNTARGRQSRRLADILREQLVEKYGL